MKDLSTLEYLYVFRCWSASSETHSCFAVSAIVSKQLCWRADARKGGRTFARWHLGAGDGGRKRHEYGGAEKYICLCTFRPCRCGESCSRTNSCGVRADGTQQPSPRRQTSRGPAGSDRACRDHGLSWQERPASLAHTSRSCLLSHVKVHRSRIPATPFAR